MSTRNTAGIVIAGAGIGGLTAAVALSRRGRPVTVLERRASLAGIGAGITLWPNALAALDVIDAGAAVRAAGAAVTAGGFRTRDGAWLRRLGDGRLALALGEALIVLGRGDLLAVLASALDPAAIRFGTGVRSWRPGTASAIEVTLTSGEVLGADGLVGADGIGSAVARGLRPGLRLTYAGYTAWRGVATGHTGDFVPAQTWGPGGEFGCLPMGGGRTYWFATENAPEGGSAPGGEREYLLRRLADWHQPIGEIIAATDPGAVVRHDIYDRIPAARWHAGPVVLIGDAAHPMRPHLGQGGCQAIEDGVLLAAAVASGGSLAAAFSHFAGARRRRVRRIAGESALVGRIIQGTGPLAAAGRHTVRLTPDWLLLHHLAGIGGSRAAGGPPAAGRLARPSR